jgi:hypothetical protein
VRLGVFNGHDCRRAGWAKAAGRLAATAAAPRWRNTARRVEWVIVGSWFARWCAPLHRYHRAVRKSRLARHGFRPGVLMSGLKWVLLVAGVLVAAAFVVAGLGASRWAQSTRALLARLEAARAAPTMRVFDAGELEGLPGPVQRYFRTVLQDGQPIVAAASVEHRGSFNLGADGEQWKPFTSTQRVVTQRPGFVWDARIAMLPGVAVHVHDAYVAGEGILHPTIAGLFTLLDLRGGGAVAEGELMRYFAEAAWYPTALLPSQGVQWAAVDERSAEATLVDGPLSLTLLFRFSDDGLIESVRAEARGRTVGSQVVMTPWQGRWSDYRDHGGMRVPFSGEVAWMLPQGAKPYWRATITTLSYEFAR